MNAHQLDAQGVIINTIVVDTLVAFPNLVSAAIGGAIGDRVVNGTVAPAQKPAVLAESVAMLNLQLVLINDGKMAQVEYIINNMEGDDGARARAYWAKALTARRDNYLVEQLWPAIGYDLAGFNDAWRRAAALNP